MRQRAETEPDLRERLRHVYWIGGGSGSGKSTVARRLADAHGARVYATDDVMADHARRLTGDEAPRLRDFASMTMDERWVTRTPQEMLETFHWFWGEGFRLIVDDLLQLPAGQPVVAEGFRLLPRLVKPLLSTPRHAAWLLPTTQFRQEVFSSRGGPAWGFIGKTSDPKLALEKLLERDRMFAQHLRDELRQLELTAVEVSQGHADDETARQLARLFDLDD